MSRPDGKAENLHSGHRKRLQDQFLENGLEGFTDVQALELLLFYAVARQDTNVTAHRLLHAFHSFRGVFEADRTNLKTVEGVGDAAAGLITLVAALNRRYLSTRGRVGRKICSMDEIGEVVKGEFAYLNREQVLLLCLDGESRLVGRHILAAGSVNSVALPIRAAVELALRENAARVVLAHNHLADIAVPSQADVDSTNQLRRILRSLDIELLDHLVVADNDYVSMRDSGYFSP